MRVTVVKLNLMVEKKYAHFLCCLNIFIKQHLPIISEGSVNLELVKKLYRLRNMFTVISLLIENNLKVRQSYKLTIEQT